MPQVYLAIDEHDDVDTAEKLIEYVDGFKIGLYAKHAGLANSIAEMSLPLFMDIKLHDIPEQMARAAETLDNYHISFISAHAAAGKNALEQFVAAIEHAMPLAVVGLSSVVTRDVIIKGRINIAKAANVAGVICHSNYIDNAKKVGLYTVVAGVRHLADNNNHVNVSPLIDCRKADMVVLGREITKAKDPTAAIIKARELLLLSEKAV